MKQVIQHLGTGITELVEVPCPQPKKGHILIRTRFSLVSVGTERMLVEFSRASLIEKARKQPEKVRQVLEKVKTDGAFATFEAVSSKLDQPIPMGYCNVGEIIGLGEGVNEFNIGDRVVSNGPHAEVVLIPKNLCSRIPPNVEDEDAAFTVLAAIALQGIRLIQPSLGECVVVTGLGLIGLVAVQILVAHGCRVLGIDLDSNKLKLARQFGAETVDISQGEDAVKAADIFTRGRGVDAVLITASSRSSEPMHQAALMCRKRGKIVLVGVTGLDLLRSDFYEKELTFQVSCSYGPGRYDSQYEEGGQDYPFGFVRWTEQRNFEAILDMLSNGRMNIKDLISHRFSIDNVIQAYQSFDGKSTMGILLDYPNYFVNTTQLIERKTVQFQSLELGQNRKSSIQVIASAIGSGNFAGQVLLPAFKSTGVVLHSLSSAKGLSGFHLGRKFGFKETTTDSDALLSNQKINTIAISTRSDTHAYYAVKAIQNGKHLFVEKPLAINRKQLKEIQSAYEEKLKFGEAPLLMVGFNRRFSPLTKKLKSLLDRSMAPKTMIMTVNAGHIPRDHWTHDPSSGGGRVINEGCHFIDLLRHVADSPIRHVQVAQMETTEDGLKTRDNVTLTLSFQDGSLGTIHYFSNGNKTYPKERLEVYCDGKIFVLNNFISLTAYGVPEFRRMKLFRQDKGHRAEVEAFVKAIETGRPSPIPFHEIVEVTETSFAAAELLGPSI